MKDAPELRDTEAQIHNLLTLAAEQVRGTATPLAPATATPGLDLAARLTALAANGAGARVAVPFIQSAIASLDLSKLLKDADASEENAARAGVAIASALCAALDSFLSTEDKHAGNASPTDVDDDAETGAGNAADTTSEAQSSSSVRTLTAALSVAIASLIATAPGAAAEATSTLAASRAALGAAVAAFSVAVRSHALRAAHTAARPAPPAAAAAQPGEALMSDFEDCADSAADQAAPAPTPSQGSAACSTNADKIDEVAAGEAAVSESQVFKLAADAGASFPASANVTAAALTTDDARTLHAVVASAALASAYATAVAAVAAATAAVGRVRSLEAALPADGVYTETADVEADTDGSPVVTAAAAANAVDGAFVTPSAAALAARPAAPVVEEPASEDLNGDEDDFTSTFTFVSNTSAPAGTADADAVAPALGAKRATARSAGIGLGLGLTVPVDIVSAPVATAGLAAPLLPRRLSRAGSRGAASGPAPVKLGSPVARVDEAVDSDDDADAAFRACAQSEALNGHGSCALIDGDEPPLSLADFIPDPASLSDAAARSPLAAAAKRQRALRRARAKSLLRAARADVDTTSEAGAAKAAAPAVPTAVTTLPAIDASTSSSSDDDDDDDDSSSSTSSDSEPTAPLSSFAAVSAELSASERAALATISSARTELAAVAARAHRLSADVGALKLPALLTAPRAAKRSLEALAHGLAGAAEDAMRLTFRLDAVPADAGEVRAARKAAVAASNAVIDVCDGAKLQLKPILEAVLPVAAREAAAEAEAEKAAANAAEKAAKKAAKKAEKHNRKDRRREEKAQAAQVQAHQSFISAVSPTASPSLPKPAVAQQPQPAAPAPARDFSTEMRGFWLEQRLRPQFTLTHTDSGLALVAPAPTLVPSSLQLSLSGRALTVSGLALPSRAEEQQLLARAQQWAAAQGPFQRQRALRAALMQLGAGKYGAIRESFEVPDDVDGDRIEGTVRDGVVTITFPRFGASTRARAAPLQQQQQYAYGEDAEEDEEDEEGRGVNDPWFARLFGSGNGSAHTSAAAAAARQQQQVWRAQQQQQQQEMQRLAQQQRQQQQYFRQLAQQQQQQQQQRSYNPFGRDGSGYSSFW